MDRKGIIDTFKLIKKFVRHSLMWGDSSSYAKQDHKWLGRYELDERSFWGGKLIGRLLLTVTVADPHRLDHKRKPMMYTRAFIKIYN